MHVVTGDIDNQLQRNIRYQISTEIIIIIIHSHTGKHARVKTLCELDSEATSDADNPEIHVSLRA